MADDRLFKNFGGINRCGQKRKLQVNAIDQPTKGDKRYVRRKADGTFEKTVDVGKSLAADRNKTAKIANAAAEGFARPRSPTVHTESDRSAYDCLCPRCRSSMGSL
jgi:hypothetical protein